MTARDLHRYPDLPFDPISRPAVVQRWEDLTFLHWRYPPDEVQRILPPDLTVDTFDDSAWVALVPFKMVRVRPPWAPALGPLTTFPETNVRTYVVGPDGIPGVWFMSLDITRLLGVALARWLFHVPYCWAGMAVRKAPETIEYQARRRSPGLRGATSRVVVMPGPPVTPSDLTRFLTNRWRAYTRIGGGVGYARVSHEPWSLRSASVLELSDQLVQASDLASPKGEPLVHYSDGVNARVGRLRRA